MSTARQNALHYSKVKSEWWNGNHLMGYNWATFFVLIGAREAGKSYWVMDYFLRQWDRDGTPFIWIRLTDVSKQKMLCNNAAKLVDPDLVRKYGLQLKTKGMDVFDLSRDPEKKKPMCKVLALSEMAKEKGVALFDKDYDGWYNICCDEFQREPGEAKRFDVNHNLGGTIENLTRSRQDKVRIFMICNLLEEANDFLAEVMGFIPEEYGIYKLKGHKNRKNGTGKKYKKCVIEYMEPTQAYLARREGAISNIIAGDSSNFTNKLEKDRRLIYKGARYRPTSIIKFRKSKDTWFTVWDGYIISSYKNEQIKDVIAMRPYSDNLFNDKLRDNIIQLYDSRALLFRDLITQKRFEKNLIAIKPRGN